MDSKDNLLIAERWMTPMHECPHCKEVQPDDSQVNEKWTCEKCGKQYILGDC